MKAKDATPGMRVCYVAKTCIGHYTQSDAIYHVPLSLARKWKLVLLTGESPRPREVAGLLDAELLVPPGRLWNRAAFAELSRHHAAHPVDVVLTGIDEASLLTGWAAQRRLGIPWIAICEDHPFQSRYDHAGAAGMIERMARTWFLRFALRFPRRLVYFIHPGVLDFLWIKDSIQAPLTNSADLETLEPIRMELERDGSGAERSGERVGYVGVLNEPKGALRMIDVFARLAAIRPEAKLRLIGRVENGFGPRLEKAVDDSGLRGRIEITGQVSPREALRLAGECAVCIHAYSPLPWLYWNQVLKVLEYMALGVPVVSVDYPGTRSLIEPGRSGVLVPHERPEAMAEAVADLLEHPEKRAVLREGGLARARQLSWKATEEKLYEMIESCVRATRAQG